MSNNVGRRIFRMVMLLVAIGLTGRIVYREMNRPAKNSPDIQHVEGANHGSAGSSVSTPIVGELPKAQKIDHFVLTGEDGKPFDSRSLKGDIWLGSFFYTSCPSICRRLNMQIAALQQDPNLKDVKFVSISVDPKNDTPEVLKQYANLFNADPNRWHFCVAPIEKIVEVGRDYFLFGVGEGEHSGQAMVIGRDGKLLGSFDVLKEEEVDALKTKLAKCLATPAEPSTEVAKPAESKDSPAKEDKTSAETPDVTEEKPAEGKPLEEKSAAEETPATESTPATEAKPVEETPADEKPVEVKPGEDKAAEEPTVAPSEAPQP